MNHPTQIESYPGTLAELTEDLGNLRYDALTDLLRLLFTKMARDADADAARGRGQLAESLRQVSDHLAAAAEDSGIAWRISAPYMREPAPGNG